MRQCQIYQIFEPLAEFSFRPIQKSALGQRMERKINPVYVIVATSIKYLKTSLFHRYSDHQGYLIQIEFYTS